MGQTGGHKISDFVFLPYISFILFFFFYYFFFRAGIIYTKSTMMLCQDKHYIHSIQMLKRKKKKTDKLHLFAQ